MGSQNKHVGTSAAAVVDREKYHTMTDASTASTRWSARSETNAPPDARAPRIATTQGNPNVSMVGTIRNRLPAKAVRIQAICIPSTRSFKNSAAKTTAKNGASLFRELALARIRRSMA